MDWDGFKTMLWASNISSDAIDVSREFVETEMAWHGSSAHSTSKTDDLGYGECGDITTVEQGIAALKQSQWMSTVDETPAKERKNLARFNQDPGKHFKRILLKTYWLTQ